MIFERLAGGLQRGQDAGQRNARGTCARAASYLYLCSWYLHKRSQLYIYARGTCARAASYLYLCSWYLRKRSQLYMNIYARGTCPRAVGYLYLCSWYLRKPSQIYIYARGTCAHLANIHCCSYILCKGKQQSAKTQGSSVVNPE